jgi:Flagellar filament outer layer protein Flaa
MKRVCAYLLILTVTAITAATAQQKPAQSPAPAQPAAQEAIDDSGISDQVYREVAVETFETVQYTEKNIRIQASRDEKAEVSMRAEYPAPIKDSKKYLGVKIHGKQGNDVAIIPPKELPITEHCQSISVWVYGKNFSGDLYMLVRDSEGQVKRFSFGKLNFLGWRKLSYTVPKDFQQEDKYLAQPKSINIVQILYKPGRTTPLKRDDWEYFYLDDISAKVRKKYVDKQSDAW